MISPEPEAPAEPAPDTAEAATAPPAPETGGNAETVAVNVTSPSHQKLVLQPTENALQPSVDLNALLAKEETASAADQPVTPPATNDVISPAASPSTTTGCAWP